MSIEELRETFRGVLPPWVKGAQRSVIIGQIFPQPDYRPDVFVPGLDDIDHGDCHPRAIAR